MASTRNNNTRGNYDLQQRDYAHAREYTTYKNSGYGEAYDTKLPGNGLNPGQVPWNKLSNNAADIESFLFGINSTNLVNPAPPLTPSLVCLQTANVFETRPVYMPQPLVVEKKQRPFVIP
jgi:hypothetical protein